MTVMIDIKIQEHLTRLEPKKIDWVIQGRCSRRLLRVWEHYKWNRRCTITSVDCLWPWYCTDRQEAFTCCWSLFQRKVDAQRKVGRPKQRKLFLVRAGLAFLMIPWVIEYSHFPFIFQRKVGGPPSRVKMKNLHFRYYQLSADQGYDCWSFQANRIWNSNPTSCSTLWSFLLSWWNLLIWKQHKSLFAYISPSVQKFIMLPTKSWCPTKSWKTKAAKSCSLSNQNQSSRE